MGIKIPRVEEAVKRKRRVAFEAEADVAERERENHADPSNFGNCMQLACSVSTGGWDRSPFLEPRSAAKESGAVHETRKKRRSQCSRKQVSGFLNGWHLASSVIRLRLMPLSLLAFVVPLPFLPFDSLTSYPPAC